MAVIMAITIAEVNILIDGPWRTSRDDDRVDAVIQVQLRDVVIAVLLAADEVLTLVKVDRVIPKQQV